MPVRAHSELSKSVACSESRPADIKGSFASISVPKMSRVDSQTIVVVSNDVVDGGVDAAVI